MGWHNPPIPWREFERRLSWGARTSLPPPDEPDDGPHSKVRRLPRRSQGVPVDALPPAPVGGDGLPAWAELHCHSSYSFLDGASDPDALVAEAARRGVEALALTDHDGMYGVVRLAEATRGSGVGTIFGAELSLELSERQNGIPDPEGGHLLVLARDPEGYGRLASAITTAQMRGGKGRPVYDLTELAAAHG
ncbi:MAG TPA: PHP domain-containing protein, partial [Jiangellaceae bacterium]|nr:PHP domain-containing protein [Jiangellaceae bacterium]